MSTTNPCPRCGTPLPKEGEPCPRCLLELGRTPPEQAAPRGSGSAPRARRRPDPTLEELAKRFPDLEIAARIGAGGMGAVYKARQPRIDRWVALKILSLDPVDDPTFAERFRREAIVLARLDHPNVVKLYDFGERDGLFFLLLEFVDGPNLRTLMKQSLLAPAQALLVVPQICEALQFAHDEGIVHRDIKPENVLLDAKGRVKIADFGLAKLVDADARDVSLTEVDQVVGTPHYMAPEQIRGSREVDHRADIYSLGVVFYEMLTGELPRGNFELPSRRVQVDVRLDEIVLKSLERAPERRYQHAVEVKTDVEGVGAGPPRKAEAEGSSKGVLVAGFGIGESSESKAAIHPNRPWEFFVTYLILWFVVGWTFNGGPWWLAAAFAVVAAFFWSQVDHAIRARPELAKALEAEPEGKRSLRHVAALLLLGGGLFSLFLGEVSIFDDLSPVYRASSVDWTDLGEMSAASRIPIPETQGVQRVGVWELDIEQLWNMPALLFAAFVLLTASALARTATTRARGSIRTSVAAVITLLLPLALLQVASFALAAGSNRGGPLAPILGDRTAAGSKPTREGGTEDLAGRLRIALLRQDYSIIANGTWVKSEPGLPPSGELQVLVAEPASPFDRWSLGWSGPKRSRPRALFFVHGARRAGTASLESDFGDAALESPLHREGKEAYERLLRDIAAE